MKLNKNLIVGAVAAVLILCAMASVVALVLRGVGPVPVVVAVCVAYGVLAWALWANRVRSK